MEQKSRAEQLEDIKREFNSYQYKLSNLRKDATLSSLSDELEDKKSMVSGLTNRVVSLRKQQYIFEPELEDTIKNLESRWLENEADVKREINRQSFPIKTNLAKFEAELKQAQVSMSNPIRANQLLSNLKLSHDSLEDQVRDAKQAVRGLYDSLSSEIDETETHINQVENAYKELGEACFKLLAQENLIMAVEAVWTKDGKEDKNDPRGNLYLTDQRLIFEQKEEVATKKVLFVTTERKLVQEELFAIPLQYIEEIKSTAQGIFKNKDFLDFKFSSQAPYHQVQLHLFGQDSDEWNRLINKVTSGEFDKNRTVPVDKEVVEKVKNAPTICPNCGASIQVVILRGMDQFNCEYCGQIIRL